MPPVRTGVLARARSVGAPATITIGTVPVTDTYIVKDVHVLNGAGLGANVTVSVARADLTIVALLISALVAAGGSTSFSGFVAAAPTDVILFGYDQAAVQVWVSGADLPGHL